MLIAVMIYTVTLYFNSSCILCS